MNAILEWLRHTTTLFGLSAPAWTFIAILAGVAVEYLLGRFAPTRCASLIALIATGLRFLLTPFGRIPGIGPMVLHALESIAGVDLDGDGNIGAAVARAEKIAANAEAVEGLPKGTVTKTPGGGAGIVLAFIGLASLVSGCATLGPIVQACKDCADEQGGAALRDLEQQAGPFVEHAFMCDPTFAGAALPPCLVAALEGVVVAMGPDGIRFRDCVIAKVEANADGKAPKLAVKRAHLARARLAAGMKL